MNNINRTLYWITGLLIILFIFIMIILAASDGFVVKDNNIYCPLGECATSLVTGEKRCPVPGKRVVPLATEVCNTKYLCNNNSTPYAVMNDGSTNINGVCPRDTVCNCLSTVRCPNYITSTFTATDGNPYMPTQGQRIEFEQSVYTGGALPINTFCNVPLNWLAQSTPGCGFIRELNYESAVNCLVSPNPCLVGNLVVITDSPESVTSSNIIDQSYACINIPKCPISGTIPIYDRITNTLLCKTL